MPGTEKVREQQAVCFFGYCWSQGWTLWLRGRGSRGPSYVTSLLCSKPGRALLETSDSLGTEDGVWERRKYTQEAGNPGLSAGQGACEECRSPGPHPAH